MLQGQKNRTDNKKSVNGLDDQILFGRKRKRSPEKIISHSQPAPNVDNIKNWRNEYKKQKALVLKYTKQIERLNSKIETFTKQTKLLLDTVNS